MNALGFHFLIELYDCDKDLLKDAVFLETALSEAVKQSGAIEIGKLFHQFSPHGVSGVILISESHFSIHTWPEYRYAAVDFFTCNEKVLVQVGYQYLVKKLGAKSSSIIEMKRGLHESKK
jgi:S-adenosylmethionine decarboxylase